MKVTQTQLPVHPAAQIFPMLADEELDELTRDIVENGQREPIVTAVVDGIETIIDGRNRLAACERAGIQPRFQKAEVVDIPAYIVSANIARSHLNVGQRAMMIALLFPEGTRGRGKADPATKSAELGGFHRQRVLEARLVIQHNPSAVEEVKRGELSLSRAYAVAKVRADETSEASQKRENDRAALASLRRRYPDLASRVDDDESLLGLALQEADHRDQTQSLLDGLNQIYARMPLEPLTDAEREARLAELAAERLGLERVEVEICRAQRVPLRADIDPRARLGLNSGLPPYDPRA